MIPHAQLHLEGYATPYRLDINAKCGGILLYIREDTPSNLIVSELPIEGFFVKMKLRTRSTKGRI